MKLFIACFFFAKIATAAPENWKLIWNDEFNDTKIDSSKWTPCKRGKSDWNDTMTNDARCYEIGGGTLRLIGIVNPGTTQDSAPYLTGGLTTKGKFAFTYGKIEIRAKFKSARGAWPALWMLGSSGHWPHNGEIDLMEHLNFDHKVHQTIHTHWANHVDKKKSGPPKSATTTIERDNFNTYGAEWDKDKIVFTVNGKPSFTYPRVSQYGKDQWPFDQSFYVILSMQIEGEWVGKADPKDYPADMEVDWVRVYQKKEL